MFNVYYILANEFQKLSLRLSIFSIEPYEHYEWNFLDINFCWRENQYRENLYI